MSQNQQIANYLNYSISKDGNVINNKLFKDLKIDLDLRVKDYFEKVISPTDTITPYITH